MTSRNWLLTAYLLAMSVPALADLPSNTSAIIYVRASASSAADGATPGSALSTLQAALDLAARRMEEGVRDVTIKVLPGTYVSQRARTSGAGWGHTLTITGEGAPSGKIVFDGQAGTGTWLHVQGRTREPTNLTIVGLTITRYSSAISLNGTRGTADNAVSHVVIKNNIFKTIGQTSVIHGKPSTAVIRLVNADENEIIDNRFLNIRNVQNCSLLHGVYVAHNSTGNLIKKNEFVDGCGDAIRFRDGANDNVVEQNRFIDAWAIAPVSTWFCDASRRVDCSVPGGECPSLNNRLVDNEMIARRLTANGLSRVFGKASTRPCSAPSNAPYFIVP